MSASSSTSDQSSACTRATDEDREHSANTLSDAFARGSLDAVEHEHRVSHVWQARFTEELAALTSDLPGQAASDPVRTRRDSEMRQWFQEWRYWLGAAVILSATWGVQALRSGPDFYWPLVPLGIWAAVLVAVAIWPSQDDT